MYIVLEGIDGCGKTTIISEIGRRVQPLNFTAICLHEPTYGEFGKRARELIQGEEEPTRQQLHELFTRDRQEHVRTKIKSALEFVSQNPSFIILQDRGYLSAPAYQASNNEEALKMLEEQMTIAPAPDLFFLIDVDVEVAMERLKRRADSRSIFDQNDALEAVRNRYIMLAKSGKVPIRLVDGSLPLTEIVDIIIESSGIVE